MSQSSTLQNPKEREQQKPPFPQQQQQPPGLSSEMQPKPDYGEQSYKGYGRLTGRTAIITGGDSGIGRAVALCYARDGADVLIAYLSEDSDARETTRLVEDAGHKCVAMRGDIGDPRHCQQIVERAMGEFGRLDILVNNASFQQTHNKIEEIPNEEIEFIFRSNILAMFWMVKAALPHMKPGGVIINTASIEAFEPKPFLVHYASTKGAIVTFTKALAEELTERGIRVNAVAPGPVWTPLIPMSMPAEKVKDFGKNTPMKRPAQPIEVATAYVYLASDDASYVSGEILGVTGGKPL